MKMPEPYAIADRVQKKLNQKALKRLDEAKRKLNILGFDDLSVFQVTDKLYQGLSEDAETLFRALYAERYTELWLWRKGKEPDEDEVDELVEMYLAGMLEKPNEVTHYAFGPELDRKRDRAKEAILAVPTKTQKQLELEKAVRFVIQQDGFYVDITSQEAEMQAYEDAGVKKVRWVVFGDDRVCKDCEELNGTVWDIDRVPTRPHPRCRCYLVPVT